MEQEAIEQERSGEVSVELMLGVENTVTLNNGQHTASPSRNPVRCTVVCAEQAVRVPWNTELDAWKEQLASSHVPLRLVGTA